MMDKIIEQVSTEVTHQNSFIFKKRRVRTCIEAITLLTGT